VAVGGGGEGCAAAGCRGAVGVGEGVWWWFAARSQISSYGREQQRRSGYGSERRGSGEQSETQQQTVAVKTQQASPCSSRGDGSRPRAMAKLLTHLLRPLGNGQAHQTRCVWGSLLK
jgi:hypothetical protein